MELGRATSSNPNPVLHANNESCLLEAEDALIDGKYRLALSTSYDLLARHAIPEPNDTVSFENDESWILSLDLNGAVSRCGAVLLQSWYELCRTTGTKNPPQHFLEVLQHQTIPLDLWIVWMTLRIDHTHDDDGKISRMALSILQKLVLSKDEPRELNEGCRDCCRELILLLFMEWLPRLPARLIHDFGGSAFPGYRYESSTSDRMGFFQNSSSSAIDTTTACLNLCREFCSASCHYDWAHETAMTCASKLQTDLLELTVEQEGPRPLSLPSIQQDWLETSNAWQTILSKTLSNLRSQYQMILTDRDALWRIFRGVIVAAILLLGYRRCRLLLRSKTFQTGMSEIMQAIGLGRYQTRVNKASRNTN